MSSVNNYLTQVRQAQERFLRYDAAALARKLGLPGEEPFLTPTMLGTSYRISRADGRVFRCQGGAWQETVSRGEVMTLLDLVCDSREDRRVCHRWKQMASFGLMFHQNLLENAPDGFTLRCQAHPDALKNACRTLGGTPMAGGDVSFALPVFEDLSVWMQFWQGDEEFPARLRWLWDENALMYLKYETMYYAVELLEDRLLQHPGFSV